MSGYDFGAYTEQDVIDAFEAIMDFPVFIGRLADDERDARALRISAEDILDDFDDWYECDFETSFPDLAVRVSIYAEHYDIIEVPVFRLPEYASE